MARCDYCDSLPRWCGGGGYENRWYYVCNDHRWVVKTKGVILEPFYPKPKL